MAKQYKPADLSKLKTFPIDRRAHKFDATGEATLPPQGASFRQWWDSLPAYLGANSLRAVVAAILDAHYLHRDPALAESAIRKLETRTKIPN